MKARLYLDVKFGKRATDAESIASALDNVMDVGMSSLDDCWSEYGGKPQVGKFFVLDTGKALDLANDVESVMNVAENDPGSARPSEWLAPVRDFLRKVAGTAKAKG
jgi:hypothetical protein